MSVLQLIVVPEKRLCVIPFMMLNYSGWFPAKFVTILDERSKLYCPAGDDSVTEGIADLVRGTLCPALKRIFENGMKKPSSLVGPAHPWLFIEEVAMKEIERDYRSVYSRLVLCKTYRLDEDGKVLSPEEVKSTILHCLKSLKSKVLYIRNKK